MSAVSGRPDVSGLEAPVDAWTQPFWDAARDHRLMFPSCAACGRFRWPPGPFCPACHAQSVIWADAGEGFVFSYTIIPGKPQSDGAASPVLVPALIAFPDAGDVRLIAAVIDADVADIRIDAKVAPVWVEAVGAVFPMFRLV